MIPERQWHGLLPMEKLMRHYLSRLGRASILLVAVLSLLPGGVFCKNNDIRIAVNTFQNQTGDPKNNWLEVGLVDNIVKNLNKVPGLRVLEIERLCGLENTIKMSHAGISEDNALIKCSRLLGIQYLVTGSFQAEGASVTVDFRMIEAGTGKKLLSDSVKGDRGHIIGLEERVNGKIAGKLTALFPSLHVSTGNYTGTAPEAVQENYAAGLACSLRSDLAGGLACFQKVLDEHPGEAEAYLGQGDIFLRQGGAEQALERFNQALVLFKEKGDLYFISLSYYKIGEAHLLQGDYDEAAASYTNALAANDKNGLHLPVIYSRLSEISWVNGKFAKAIKYAKMALAENDKTGDTFEHVRLLVNLTVLYRETNRLTLANESLKNAITMAKEVEHPDMERLNKLSLELRTKK
jgi:tetratricopeptide (TPR) repeat protein